MEEVIVTPHADEAIVQLSLSQILTAVAQRIIVREGVGFEFLGNRPSEPLVEQTLALIKKTFCSDGHYGWFNPTDPQHLQAVNKLRCMLGLPCIVPKLSDLCTLTLFNAKKNFLSTFGKSDMIGRYDSNTRYWSFTLYNLEWKQRFPELFSDLTDRHWFCRDARKTDYNRKYSAGVFLTLMETVRLLLLQSNSNATVASLGDEQLLQCLSAVFLDGLRDHIKAMVALCIQAGKQNILKSHCHRATNFGNFDYSLLLLLCLRNIFDPELFELLHSTEEAVKNRVFTLHEPITLYSAACYHGNFQLLEWLTLHGEIHEVNCLDHAIRGGKQTMIEHLVEKLGKKLGDVNALYRHFTPGLYDFLIAHDAITSEQIAQLRRTVPGKGLFARLGAFFEDLNPNQEACRDYFSNPSGLNKGRK